MYIPLTDDELVGIIIGLVWGTMLSIGFMGMLSDACEDIEIRREK